MTDLVETARPAAPPRAPAVRSPIPYFGSKGRIAERIADLLPPHDAYLEPFGGSLSVLLAKAPALTETVNDLDGQLVTFWRVLRDRPTDLIRACALTPHSRTEFNTGREFGDDLDDLEVARRVWLQLAQSRSATRRRTGWRQYIDPAGTRLAMPGYLDAYVERMAAAAARLHDVTLDARPAIELIEQFGRIGDVLIYADPPYLGSVRAAKDNRLDYAHDMPTEAEHAELLAALRAARAAVVISGYPSPIYDEQLADWHRVEIPTVTGNGAGGNRRRLEVLWSNRPIGQAHLFPLTGWAAMR